MEKHNSQPEPVEIPRNSPTITVKIGERALDLTWYNSVIQAYKAPYQAMSHLEHTVDNQRLMIFTPDGGDDRNFVGLMANGFPIRLDSEPSDAVVRYYTAWQADEAVKVIESYDPKHWGLHGGEMEG